MLEQFSSIDELDTYSKNLEYQRNDKKFVEKMNDEIREKIMRNQEEYLCWLS